MADTPEQIALKRGYMQGWTDSNGGRDYAPEQGFDYPQRAAQVATPEPEPAAYGPAAICVSEFCSNPDPHPIHQRDAHPVEALPAEPKRRCGPFVETSPGVSTCQKCGDINFDFEDDEPSAGGTGEATDG